MAADNLFPVYTESPYSETEGKVLLADRVYVGPENTALPTTAAAGVTPVGFEDLGSIDKSYVTLEKGDPDIIPVETGLYQVLRDEVARKDGDATAKWTMVEYEPANWAALTGDVEVPVGLGTSIFVGGRPLLRRALLLVGQNAVTGSEFHHYNPRVNLTYKVVEIDQFRGIEVTARLLKFKDPTDVTGISRDFQLVQFPAA